MISIIKLYPLVLMEYVQFRLLKFICKTNLSVHPVIFLSFKADISLKWCHHRIIWPGFLLDATHYIKMFIFFVVIQSFFYPSLPRLFILRWILYDYRTSGSVSQKAERKAKANISLILFCCVCAVRFLPGHIYNPTHFTYLFCWIIYCYKPLMEVYIADEQG